MQETQNETKSAAAEVEDPSKNTMPLARISLLYESRDHKICLFEDAQGHLVAAPSSILA